MFRSSRRKPQQAQLPKRSTTPNPRRKQEENRPAWDVRARRAMHPRAVLGGRALLTDTLTSSVAARLQDTCGDVSKYKATPEEIARRRQQRVSKNLITAEKLQAEGQWMVTKLSVALCRQQYVRFRQMTPRLFAPHLQAAATRCRRHQSHRPLGRGRPQAPLNRPPPPQSITALY